ncbi:hypothetical protein CKO11_13425 [Rhodobacter sp. TJ_12]|uniref:BRO-N domain-containing protein n=1 Tax=Rhodobacter sp. TJ_12 TaxID=2029399 RepID=UPI001CBEC03D|nr:BRO family protein [Rhodobacter sp. TJ_12]MBZ4023458.1 hypothetical protein [Rhodobacter sp. TJ_12]
MSNITSFTFNHIATGSRAVRVIELEGEPWFVAKDVCDVLGLTNVTETLNKLSPTEVIRLKITEERGSSNKLVCESGLYKLIMCSDKPSAFDFQHWVTGTVLPAIRKDGGYIMGEEKVVTGEMDEDELVLRAIEVQKRKIERLRAERDSARHQV